jgi:ABC-type Fe3+-hydroxamate transport system substrate-binding protein
VAVRVVSLVPSVTETLLAWGVAPVGVTRFCEHPELPAVGGTKDPDLDAVLRLGPDLVVVNDEENRRQDADALVAAGVDVHVVRIDAVSAVAPELAALAERLGVEAPPAADLPEPVPPWRSAFVPIWRRPWMSLAGTTYGSSVLAWLGVANVFDDAATRYPEVTLEEASLRRPDLVLAPSEPYPFGPRHVAELSQVAPVRLVDGQDLFWWGVRTPAALARLTTALGDA